MKLSKSLTRNNVEFPSSISEDSLNNVVSEMKYGTYLFSLV